MFCTKCGKQIPDNSRFCLSCGAPAPATPGQPPQTQIPRQDAGQPQMRNDAPSQSVQPQSGPVPGPQVRTAAPNNVPVQPKAFHFTAPSFTGEAVLGGISGSAAGLIPGPGKVIASGAKNFIGSLKGLFRDPKKYLPAVILAGLWLILDVLQAFGINFLPTRILSFLSFANGGMNGGIAGAIGGIIGKGIFAGAVTSLVSLIIKGKGSGKSLADTFKGIFSVTLDTLWAYLTGAGVAMLIYLFISGGATRISFMGGIAAAYLSARAALSGGFLKTFLGSIVSKGKSTVSPGVTGVIRGLSVGFAAAALIGFSGINLILIILGGLLTVGGGVMMILQATGAVRLGKGAGVR